MPVKKLEELLNGRHVKYVRIIHSPAYTAQEIAATAHIPGKKLAKTVMVKLDGKMAMVVLPALYKIDLDLLKGATGASTVSLASESEFKVLFPDCEVGAMPPFGNLYGMEVFVSKELTEDKQIAFNAGSHTELIQLAYKDFERLVNPKRIEEATVTEAKLASPKAEFLSGLNEDLAAEWGTIIRYAYQAGKSFGIVGAELREIFLKEIPDELGHATFLTDVIVDLGGEPTTVPKTFAKPDELKEMLELDLKMELADVENYTTHAKMAEQLGEAELKVKLEEMAADEAGHTREIRRLLKGL